MAFKFKGSISAIDETLKGGIIFDNTAIDKDSEIVRNKTTINKASDTHPQVPETVISNFGYSDDTAGMLAYNTGDFKNTSDSAVKLYMKVRNANNESDWVTVFNSDLTTLTWSSLATAGQTQFTVPNLEFSTCLIFINGVFQVPGYSYDAQGGNITFSETLSQDDEIYAIVGNNSTSTKIQTFSTELSSSSSTVDAGFNVGNEVIFVNGILQYPGTYTVSGTVITFSTELSSGESVYVYNTGASFKTEEHVATQSQTTFSLSSTLGSEPLVFVNGVLQYKVESYEFDISNNLVFTSELDSGDLVFIYPEMPNFIDSVLNDYLSTADVSNNSSKFTIPYFHFSEMQVFINGILQNFDTGAYTKNGTQVTLSSALQEGDDIHVIVFNAPIKYSQYANKSDLSNYTTLAEYQKYLDRLEYEGINFSWRAHLPSVEVSLGLPRNSLGIWSKGNTSVSGKYWLYTDGTVWTGVGTMGSTPDSPFYQIQSNRDVTTWTYVIPSDGTSTVTVPYTFGACTLFINGVLQSTELGNYSINGSIITFSTPLLENDNIICVLGKLSAGNSYLSKSDASNLFVSKSNLSSSTGANLVGTTSGKTVQQELDTTDKFLGAYEDGVITITSANSWITYNGERWYVKPGTALPYTTTGLNSTSWAIDSANFTDAISTEELAASANKITLSQGGTVQKAQYVVTPQMVSDDPYSDFGIALSKAIAIAQTTGRTVDIPGGDYKQTTGVDVTLTAPLSINFSAGAVVNVTAPVTAIKINVNAHHLCINGNQASFFSNWGSLTSDSECYFIQVIDNSLDKTCSISDIKLGYVGVSKFDYALYLQCTNLSTYHRNLLQAKNGVYLESSLSNGATARAMGCQFIGNEIYTDDVVINISNQGQYGCEGLIIADGEYISNNRGLVVDNTGLLSTAYLPPLIRIRGNHFNTYAPVYLKDVSRVYITDNDFQSRHSTAISVLGVICLGGVQGLNVSGNTFTSVSVNAATSDNIAPPVYQFASALTNAFFTVCSNNFWLTGMTKGAMAFAGTTNVATIAYGENWLDSAVSIVDSAYKSLVRVADNVGTGNAGANAGLTLSTSATFSNNVLAIIESPSRGEFYEIPTSILPSGSSIAQITFPNYMVGKIVTIKLSAAEVNFTHGVSMLCPDTKSFMMTLPNTIQVFVYNTSACAILQISGVNSNRRVISAIPTSATPGYVGDEYYDTATNTLYKYVFGVGWCSMTLTKVS